MCGVAGIVRFDGRPVEADTLVAMTDRLVHRGPDDQGVWVAGPVGFGHRRLSIIDLAGSPQPMASADGRLHIAFNGEILNYRELRSGLSYPFRTTGDTETLLAAFDAHGAASVEHLSGQFAFAIHDGEDGSVWLFRDRLGILPLYYWLDDEQLVFASEIKALFPALPRRPAVDPQGLASYLAHRSVPAPRTLFAGVRKLKPGHRLHVSREGSARVERWWSIPEADTSQATPGGRRHDPGLQGPSSIGPAKPRRRRSCWRLSQRRSRQQLDRRAHDRSSSGRRRCIRSRQGSATLNTTRSTTPRE